jgi:hypothetical protein
MSDFSREYEREHMKAVRVGAAGRNGEVREPDSYLKFTEVDSSLKKGLKAAMKKDSKPKTKPKASLTKKPLSSSGTGQSNEPPKKSALEKRLLEIGWKRYEQAIKEGWR